MQEEMINQIEEASMEFLQCPYCGCKLERIKDKKNNTWLKPTSCVRCNKHNIVPNVKEMVFVSNLKDIPDTIINYKGYCITKGDTGSFELVVRGREICYVHQEASSVMEYIDKYIFTGYKNTYDRLIDTINNKKIKMSEKLERLKKNLSELIIKEQEVNTKNSNKARKG